MGPTASVWNGVAEGVASGAMSVASRSGGFSYRQTSRPLMRQQCGALNPFAGRSVGKPKQHLNRWNPPNITNPRDLLIFDVYRLR